MQLSLAYSPCPNDTFIFDAMVHHKIDTEGIDFTVVHADVEQLNQAASAQTWDITKLSFHAFAYLMDDYQLLTSGAALGFNCGPMLIGRSPMPLSEVSQARIAIPGKLTTANFLLSLAFPEAIHKEAVLFSDIEKSVLDGRADLGLIIHENRFTYQDKGLHKIIDLGEWWESQFHLPIPLGGIGISRKLDRNLHIKIDRILKRSIEFAFANPDSALAYIQSHAQEMEASVVKQHIELYVNTFSLDLGEVGRAAITKMYEIAVENDIIKKNNREIYLNY